jgi:hypothetical protein
MPLFSRGPSIPAGWIQAPGDVQAEIFLVWQEDELPDELKNAPGYIPFTLSPGAEAWVRGMAEVKEIDGPKEKLVIGRPRPATSVHHRPLIDEPAPVSFGYPAPPQMAEPSVAPPPLWEPNMSAKEWVRRQAPRAAPAIAVRTDSVAESDEAAVARPAPRSLPSIGGDAPPEQPHPPKPATQTRATPQIGPPGELGPADRAPQVRAVPQIGPAGESGPLAEPDPPPREHESPRRIPDIGAP